MILIGIDYLTGLIVAGVFHKSTKTKNGALESKAGFKGLCRKAVILLIVLMAFVVGFIIIAVMSPIIGSYSAIESSGNV